ncbi:MAG TPA: ISL3 family transposase [Guyparkeria sp.]|nr:ISL3 family transposase [Guyparkeria sp.]
MSTSLLYHAFGVRGYRHVATDFREGRVIFRIEQPRERLRCPRCGTPDVFARGTVFRQFRTVPIGSKPVVIELDVPRVSCRKCGIVRQVRVGFADPRRSYTKAFERYVLELSRSMTIRDVARHLQVSWDLVKDIQKRSYQKRFSRPKLKHLTRIAIDEISVGKGHRYVTIVLDLDTGAVVFVGRGKGADALDPFWKRLRSSGARIAAVATDMSPAYIQAVRENLPEATLVFDRFHVVKLFHEKLTELRRQLYREATDRLHKDVLKGTRWLLLKNPENLDETRNERERLDQALALNHSLATAYYLKEDLRQFWDQAGPTSAELFLRDWTARAEASGIRILKQFAQTLQAHRAGLLAYYKHPISTGPLEGTNNKIKTMKRQAYGFRDMDFFILKILALHESKYALVG